MAIRFTVENMRKVYGGAVPKHIEYLVHNPTMFRDEPGFSILDYIPEQLRDTPFGEYLAIYNKILLEYCDAVSGPDYQYDLKDRITDREWENINFAQCKEADSILMDVESGKILDSTFRSYLRETMWWRSCGKTPDEVTVVDVRKELKNLYLGGRVRHLLYESIPSNQIRIDNAGQSGSQIFNSPGLVRDVIQDTKQADKINLVETVHRIIMSMNSLRTQFPERYGSITPDYVREVIPQQYLPEIRNTFSTRRFLNILSKIYNLLNDAMQSKITFDVWYTNSYSVNTKDWILSTEGAFSATTTSTAFKAIFPTPHVDVMIDYEWYDILKSTIANMMQITQVYTMTASIRVGDLYMTGYTALAVTVEKTVGFKQKDNLTDESDYCGIGDE